MEKLIRMLDYEGEIPKTKEEQKFLFRALMNMWIPKELPDEFYVLQNKYLQENLKNNKITKLEDLKEIKNNVYLWQGDITTLEVDSIVNAGNSQLLGCFIPHHKCIDNVIHSQAGLQLRLECFEIMKKQGSYEKTGKAKITNGYNLPAKYVIHTVGPIVHDEVTNLEIKQLEDCYKSCLQLAVKNNLESIAFCCVSTGEFRFPNELAGQIAVKTVLKFLETNKNIKVIFNVFKDEDKIIYEKLLNDNNIF